MVWEYHYQGYFHTTVYVKTFKGENFCGFRGFLLNTNVLPLKIFPVNNYYVTIKMALLKYFKIEKRGLPLPNPSGSLNQQLSSTAIEEANKEVTAVLCTDPAKHQPYLKISPEQKAIIEQSI